MPQEWEPTLGSKSTAVPRVAPADIDGSAYRATRGGNAQDLRDMARMGKSQELQRNFKLVTMFGFSAILMCSWESLLSSMSIALTNGGAAGLIWTWFASWMGFTFVYLSMAEVIEDLQS